MPIFQTETTLIAGHDRVGLGRLQELNDPESGASLSLITLESGRIDVSVEPSIIDEARIKFSLQRHALDGFVQIEEDGVVEQVMIGHGSEFTLGKSALKGLFMPSTLYPSGLVPNLDTRGRTYVYRLRGFVLRTVVHEQPILPWEVDDIHL